MEFHLNRRGYRRLWLIYQRSELWLNWGVIAQIAYVGEWLTMKTISYDPDKYFLQAALQIND